ncbi:Transposase for insertion sequence element IS1328 [Erwinia sp. Ejp617]|nr:Transposase for insertion sequence element IS1328 [Erwinia sp. Ejp617]
MINQAQYYCAKKFTCTKLIEFLAGCTSATVVMKACAGAHFMARRIADLGHEVKLIFPQFVPPFVKSNKNDFVDAEAICEAASVPRCDLCNHEPKLNRLCGYFTGSGNRWSEIKSKRPIKCRRFCWNSASVCRSEPQ